MTIVVGIEPLTREQVVAVARRFEHLSLSAEVVERLTRQREAIDALVDSGEPIYGLSTGFGSLATTFISPERRRDLQRSLIRSHAAGVGPEVEAEVVRAMMVSRLTNLCSGVSGVRPSTAQAYAAMINANVTPIVHEFGSLGCSGDLAPLAHVALALMGEGDVRDAGGARRRAVDALSDAGLAPVELAEKEGLALINGTDGMLGMLILALDDALSLMQQMDLAASLSIQALRGTDQVFVAEIHQLRPHPGQLASAQNLANAAGRLADRLRAPARTSPRCKTRTRCAAPLRCTAPLATPSRTPRGGGH